MDGQVLSSAPGKIKQLSLRAVLRAASMPAIAFAYCAGLNFAYVQWVAPVWNGLGFVYNVPNQALVILGYLFAVGQCLVSPLRIRRPSQAIYWLLYFLVYLPGLFVPLYLQMVSTTKLFLLQLSLSAGMLPIALSYRMSLPAIHRHPLKLRLFWSLFGAVYLVSSLTLVMAFRGSLQLASFTEIYSVRYQASLLLDQYPAMGYVTQLLGNIMNPALIAYGLVVHRKKMIALGVLGQVLIYSTAAAKSILVSPLVILIVYFTFKSDRGNWVNKLGLGCAGIVFGLTALVVGTESGIVFNVASVVLMRTCEMPGLLLAQYQYFFESNPHTYLGDVHGVNLLVSNPYTSPLGVEVSRFLGIVSAGGANGDVVSNGSFFAMDGIAGFGLPGIPLIGLFCAGVFWLMDGCARHLPIAFSVSALTMIIISLTNVSLFTTLLGNGLIAWMVLFLIIPGHFAVHDSKT